MHRATLLLFSLVVLVLALSTSHVALSAGLDRDVEGLLPPRLQQQDSPSDPDFGVDPELFSARTSLSLNVDSAPGIRSESVGDTSTYRRQVIGVRTFTITNTMNDATFAYELCATLALSGTYNDIRISNSLRRLLILPSCVATARSNVLYFTASYLIINNWSHLPSTLEILSCPGCRFYKAQGAVESNNDGWDSNGKVSWSEVFSRSANFVQLNLPSGSLPASLPTSLPATLTKLDLTSCGITGTISPTLLSAASMAPRLELYLSGNAISGSIPSNIFASLQSNSNIDELRVVLHNNNLNGSLPSGLFQPLQGKIIPYLEFRLDGNRGLSGSIPSDLFSYLALGSISFDFRLDRTDISGPVPEGFLSRYGSVQAFRFSASNSKITGPLPTRLFSANWRPSSYVTLDLSNCKLNGTIPPGFLSGNLPTNRSLSAIDLLLHNNDLEGTIPPSLLWIELDSTTRASYLSQTRLVVRLSGNRLSGSIPPDLFSQTMRTRGAPSGQVTLDLSDNALSGSIPQQIFSSLEPTPHPITINARNNRLSGSLPPCTETTPIFSLDLQNNTLSGSIPTSWNQCKLSSLNLDSNVGLVGSIPSDLLNTTDLKVFRAANTSLEGELPSISTTLTTLILTKTNIDFCSPSSLSSISGFALPSRSCEVSGTSACECVASYTPCSPSLNDTCPLLEPSSPTASPSPSPSPAVVSPATTPEPASNVPAGAPTSSPSMTPQNAPSSSPIIPTVPTSSPSSVTPQTAPSSSPNVPNFPPAINTPQSSPSSPSMPTAPPGVPSSQPTSAPSGMTPQNSPSSPNMPSGPNSPPSMPPSSSPIIPAVPSSSPSGISPHSAPDSSPIVSTVPGYSPSVITPPNEPSSSPVIPAVPSSTPSGMTPHNAPSSSPGMSSSPNSPSSTTPQITPTTDSVDNPTSSSTPITASLLLLVHCAVIWMIFM